jgi:hypothetical protein
MELRGIKKIQRIAGIASKKENSFEKREARNEK